MLNWAIGIDMYTLMCIKLMPNKNLQYKKKKSLVIREIQIKTTVIYHFTPTKMTIIKKTITRVGKDVEKLELFVHC